MRVRVSLCFLVLFLCFSCATALSGVTGTLVPSSSTGVRTWTYECSIIAGADLTDCRTEDGTLNFADDFSFSADGSRIITGANVRLLCNSNLWLLDCLFTHTHIHSLIHTHSHTHSHTHTRTLSAFSPPLTFPVRHPKHCKRLPVCHLQGTKGLPNPINPTNPLFCFPL